MLLRLLFYTFNYSAFADASAGQTFLAFIYGLRFDIAAITIINAPFILSSIFPWGNTLNPVYQRVLKVWFILTNAPFIALALVDVEFFKFIGKRSSNEVATITADIADQLGQLMQNYWFVVLGFIFIVYLFAKVYPTLRQPYTFQKNIMLRAMRLLFVAALAVLAIRGGWQLKPLRVSHAFILEPASLGHLSLNSPFTFIKGIGKVQLEQKNYFPDQQSLLAAMAFDPTKYSQQDGEQLKENVVIIILESFAAEYVGALNNGKGYTPFLDSMATQGVLFNNAFANGRKSIEALPSVLSGIPSLMQDPYITSTYQANKIHGIGTVLQEAGYNTAFFHGAANGTMGFNNYSKLAGIQEYYGLDEYPSEKRAKDFDGLWGIFDEPYLQYVATKLNDSDKPFFATLFTLSSHQPYTVPAKYKGRFPQGELEIHESIGYADHALREFFKTASKQPWYNNTLFILTADHTQKSLDPAYQNELGYYRVPLLLFHPGKRLQSINPEQIAQHTDILPTIVDYLNINTNKVLPFGKSLLNSTTTGNAILFNGNSYLLVQQNAVTELTLDDQVRFYTFPDFVPTSSPAPASEQQLKAYVQYFRSGMVNNRLYLE
ncbi:phosphoglycerol transferase MdoB-like AlkP superfamily enzyme [Pontibacter aydingkolensis]|uniref:Sulfatase-like hydrolase/transferase n=2 Tax=Pontibacter aydingkolensis TaxID=1911536 RepID=A0ABS7CVX5_9BACT|nr:alkaline phosphatase family protein [Pontibacter aydingkolensis]MBW7467972.1 sulfatase-like hydrolase/transferase [Pontibacter aydingkolensis]